MFLLEVLRDVAIFTLAIFGAGAALAPSGPREPLRRLCAGVAIALGGYFLLGFGGFALGLSNPTTALIIGSLIVLTLVARRTQLTALLSDPDVRQFALGWLLFAGWILGLLGLVSNYSGGGWAVDWVEHWQRTQFFVERQPIDTQFANIYPLTARPPLVNMLVALALEGTAKTFGHFQAFLALFGSLILLPAWILARDWSQGESDRSSSSASGWWVVLVFCASPLVAENLTFAWTKLPTAFLILAGLMFIAPTTEPRTTASTALAALCLSLAILAHYSAVPWTIAIGAAALVVLSGQRKSNLSGTHEGFGDLSKASRLPLRTATIAAVVFTFPLLLWIGWAVAHFGWQGAQANSTTAAWHEQTWLQRIVVPAKNLFDTIIPFPLRGEPGDGLIAQVSQLGRLRDVAFNLYQLNLLLGCGLAGIWVLALRLRRNVRPVNPGEFATKKTNRTFYFTLVSVALVLGIVVHTPRDEWGLVHICLQPLVLLGSIFVGTSLAKAKPKERALWAMWAAIDLALGIVLQFGIESGAWGGPLRSLSRATLANAGDKAAFHFAFFADALHAAPALIVLWLALCLGGVIVRLASDARRL